MIELYDMGRCTHKAVPGMYEFIVQNAGRYVRDSARAEQLKTSATRRELPGFSIPQDQFTEMCGIWVAAYHSGDFPIDVKGVMFPDTPRRFWNVYDDGHSIGILTSGSKEFAQVLYNVACRVQSWDHEFVFEGKVSELVNEYLLGEEIGDKDHAETFGRLWEAKQGQIAAVFDDKVSVCEAAVEGFRQAGGSSRIYLVDRKGIYNNLQEELGERVKALETQGVRRIRSFDELGWRS